MNLEQIIAAEQAKRLVGFSELSAIKMIKATTMSSSNLQLMHHLQFLLNKPS